MYVPREGVRRYRPILDTPDIAHDVLTRVRELVDAQVASDPRAPVAAELADICARLANLARAIAVCGSLPEFIEDAQALEARRQRLTELLESLPARLSTPAVDWRVLECQAYQMLDQWRALLADDVADVRRVLRELLDGPLRFTPVIDEGVRFDGFLTIGDFGRKRRGNKVGVPGRNRRKGPTSCGALPSPMR